MDIWKCGVIWTLFLLNCINASPLKNPHLCGYPVCEPGVKFNYLLDTKYIYKYSVDVSTLFRGTSENRSTLYVDANVHVNFIAPCQGVLKLSDVSLTEQKSGYNREEDEDILSPQLPKADSFSEALSKNSVRFSFDDGNIGEVCPAEEEPVWVLNFKRGVLSAFHNTMKRFDIGLEAVEADVNGDCLTKYELKEARGTSLVINKEKIFSTCTNRYKYHTVVQANQYDFGSNYQNVPLVKSRHRCEFSIDHKIYSNIECEEIHTFQPFSHVENGSQTITRQRLLLISENSINSTLPDAIEQRTDLLYDHNATPKPTSGELKASRDLLKTLCRLDVDDVQVEYPETFSKLIQVGRHLSYGALIQIYNRAGSVCSSGRKHIMDALPYLGSDAAVTVMREAIEKNSIPEHTAREWLFSLSLIPRPSEETLSAAVPLIYHPSNDSQYLLSVSALVHSFCKYHPDCHKSEKVQEILRHIEMQVESGCGGGYLRREPQEKVLVALKSLGNIGLTTGSLETTIKKCVENEQLNMDVRVSAIQSHRRLHCLKDRDYFLDLYRNSSFDTELRIASYLEVMRCPNYFVISTIKMILESEEVNQVGSFVWSHLQNLLKSSMPSKVEIQSLLTDKTLSEKFNIDRRKFSRNYEKSVFFEEYNVGGSVESNVIFSPKSYIPRSGMVNLTVDLFGESINVFEIDARVEGFETVLEHAFGPGAPFGATEVGAKLEKYMRVIRSVTEEEDPFVQQAEDIPNVIDNNFKVPKVALGFKVFGNEISYNTMEGHAEFSSLFEKLSPERRIKQLLSGSGVSFDKATMFLDADYIVPTGVGFPITLTAVGTAAVNLNMVGNVKSLELLALDIEGKFRPSVAIDITGQMGVDAYYASTGVKLKTSFYSSTAVEGHVKVEGATFAKVSFNLPKEKAEIITAQSELIVLKNGKEEVQSGITENRVSSKICSWPALDNTLGLKLCVDLAFPNATEFLNDTIVHHTVLDKANLNRTSSPNFPLSGPGKIAVALYKADPTAQQYVLQYKWQHEENTTTVSLVFDTPGSEQHRELSARLILDKSSRNLTLLLQGVENKFEAHGKYKYTPTEKYLDFSLDINGKKHFVAQIGIRTREVKHGHIYQPKLYLAVNEERIAELSGTVKIVEKSEISLCEINLEFKTKKLSTKLNGNISRGTASYAVDLKLDYRFTGGKDEFVKLTTKLVNKSSKSLTQFIGDLALETSAYQHFNFESSLKYQRAQGHADCKIEINTKPYLKDDAHKFTIQFVFSLYKTYERTTLHTYVAITKPASHIDIKLALNHLGQDDKSNTVLVLRYATGKEIIVSLVLAMPRAELFKLDAKLNVTLPSFTPMIFIIKIDEKKLREYDIAASGTWFSGHNFTAKGIYTDKSEGAVTSHSLKLFLTSPSFNDIAFNGKLLTDDTQFKLDLQADHNNEKYALALKHAVHSPSELEVYGEIRYKLSVYSVSTIVNLMKQRQVLMELHLDQHRDIHIALSGVNIPTHKQAAVEVKWDANRDPSQKFAAVVRFLHPRALNYSGDFSVSYPGREVKGAALFAILGTHFDSSARLEWSPVDVIDLKLGAVYQSSNHTSLRVRSQMLTPFPGWKRTSISGGLHRENNQLRLNGSVWWQDDQTISFDIFGDYAMTNTKSVSSEEQDYSDSDYDILLRPDLPDLWIEFNASLVSTVPEVKPMSAAFSHKQGNNRFDTIVHLKGQSHQLISVNSSWALDQTPNSTNITGSMSLLSSYPGYQRGKLVGRLHYTKDLDVHGVAELDLDRKKYMATIHGHVKSMRDNMLTIDVETPIQSFSKISGRLGYSELNRHLTCLWESPTSSVGFEILFAFEDTSDFDLMFLLATPLEFFSKLLLRAQLKPQMADFRIGFNDLLLGVEGSWRYKGIFDLAYKYTLYTPLDGFRENGVVARIIYQNSVDVELRVRVADVKLGAMLQCGHKPKTLTDLKDEPGKDEDDSLRWHGHAELDTYFYRTIIGNIDIDEIGDVYIIEGSLVLPNGTVNVFDELNFKDIFTIKNALRLNTTYLSFKELNSIFNWDILIDEFYIVELDLDVFTSSQLKKGGIMLNYTISNAQGDADYETETDSGPTTHRGRFHLHSPWEELPLLDAEVLLEIEDNVYRTNVTLFTNESRFSVAANSEADDGFVDASIGMVMTSPTYKIPEFKLSAKRDVTDVEKTFEVTLFFKPPVLKNYHVEGTWHYEPSSFVKLRGKLETPIEYLSNVEALMIFSQDLEENRLSMDTRFAYCRSIDIKFNGHKKDKAVTFDAEIPIEGFRKLHFEGTLNRGAGNVHLVNGVLNADKVSYNVEGSFEATENSPVTLGVALRPQTQGHRSLSIEISVNNTATGHKVYGMVHHGRDLLEARGTFDTKSETNWKIISVIDSTHPNFKHLRLDALVIKKENGMVDLEVKAVTPWKGLENVQANASYLNLERTGRIRGNFEVPKMNGYLVCDYSSSYLENMAVQIKTGYDSEDNGSKYLIGEVFYRNPSQTFKYLSVGVDADLNKSWMFGANGTLSLPALDDLGVALNLKLPPPDVEVHSVVGKLRYTKGYTYAAHTLKYTNQVGRAVYGTSGEMSTSKGEVQGNVKLEWGNHPNAKAITNVLLLKRHDDLLDLQYNLHTPKYKEDTFLAKVVSTKQKDHYDLKAHLFSPKSNLLSSAVVQYQSVYNMNGTVNSTTPFPQLPYAGAHFEVITQQFMRFRRFLRVMWPNNTALLDSDYTDAYRKESRGLTRKVEGKLLVEIPLATRHIGDVTYGYDEVPLQATGYCLVDYNKKRLLDGKYNCDSESRAGFDKDVIDISLENTYMPLGVHYVHQFEYSAGNEGTNYPTIDKKSGDIFRLNNRSAFNLSGNLEVKTTHTGKDIKVTAIHANRTVHLDTDYHFLDHEFKHSSWIKLDPAVWTSYNLHIVNKTTIDRDEEHVKLDISYPRRNFTVTGFFRSDSKRHDSEVRLDWDKPHNPKTVGTALNWWRVSRKPDQQVATVSFKHPSFVKDVTFNGTYIRHGTKSLVTRMDVEYSDQPHKKLVMEGKVQDLSSAGSSKYRMNILAKHPATKLDLEALGEVFAGHGEYIVRGDAKYKRSFLNLQQGDLQARVNTNHKEVDLHKRLQSEESYLRGRLYNDDPCCTKLNGSVAKTDVMNYTGDFYIDIEEKILEFTVNMTPDASETFHASGRIPDARNALLNVWRDYDDVTITDIAYYLRLNHSRLVTSRLKWRPTLQKEITSGIEYIYMTVLKHLDDTLDYWKEYTRSETKEAVSDIWFNAKPDIQQFLDEIEELKSLEQDFEEFKKFLNNSYNDNDFYIKDITGAVIVLVDELAIKGHIQSLPDILNEIWQIMGESGEAIRKSLIWIIETIKTSYRKAMEFLKGLLKGDSTEQISAFLGAIIDRYDKLVKDLQLSVVRHIEQLWNNFVKMLSEYWEYVLKSIEPTFIKLLHYVESVVWQASTEILDFLYDRKVELTGSPYFAKLANFTQDVDRFYKDITQHDIVTNVRKYSKIAYEFMKEKYFSIVPFGKEIQKIIEEIINEFKELQKLPSINYLVTKSNEIYDKLVWFYESLDLGTKAQNVVTIIHSKLMDVKQSALEADSRYREAKTKFIFDTEDGLVLLEQKLPMSWHAFNVTPKFEEIPEYRVVAELQNHLTISNKTFWTLYYEYKPYTEIQNWLPPFKAQAIIAGSQHFMTFDKTFYEFRGPCNYLLARDFVNGKFSLLMTKDPHVKSDHFLLTVISNGVPVTVDMFSNTNSIRLPKALGNQLPAEIGDLHIYKESGVITIEQIDGFSLQCNVLFYVCTFKLSGWYYGKTAGLLGTMDHESTTDMLTSQGTIETDVGRFARSWAVDQQTCETSENQAHFAVTPSEELYDFCTVLFKSKNSPFFTCFNRVNPVPFMTMCLNTGKTKDVREMCTAAVAYTQACHAEYTPLPIPDVCIQCSTPEGKLVPEGKFLELRGDQVPTSSDVVFLIEAKECNRELHVKRNMDLLVSTLYKELTDAGVTDPRFAMVVFGGDGVYNKPRTLMINQNPFTSPQVLVRFFRRFPIGNGNEDIFEAIAFASALEFRAGVSKIFIAIPCSNCDPSNMTMEYSVLRQVLVEGNIKLHILMNNEFSFEKQRVAKIFFGLDGEKAFTKKDFKQMQGDSDLRRQAKLPKSIMGYCAPLALETNGTVFTGKRLETKNGDKKNVVKKFTTVFSKRVAQFSMPSTCQNCECTSYETGMSYMDCHPCEYPLPANIDLGLNDDEDYGYEGHDFYEDDILRHPDQTSNAEESPEEAS